MKEWLRLDHHRVVTLIGAGGKSTAMYYLAHLMAKAGRRVLVTTTTRIYYQQSDENRWVEGRNWDEWVTRLEPRIRPGDFLVTGTGIQEGKVTGVASEWIDRLQRTDLFDLILVEGDGAARKPIKAPAGHEPVIPASTTLLLPVVGMRGIGRPFGGEFVHRPERFAALTGISAGEPIHIEHCARIFCHPQGYHLAAHLRQREVVPLINQADHPCQEAMAVALAGIFLREGMKMVLVTSYHYSDPVRRVCR